MKTLKKEQKKLTVHSNTQQSSQVDDMQKEATRREQQVHAIADTSATDLARRQTQADELVDQMMMILSDTISLTEEQRKNAVRIRGADEAKALIGVLDYADRRPQLFTMLADEHSGLDSKTFETGLLRDRILNSQVLQAFGARLIAFGTKCMDSAAYVENLAKPAVLKAYEVAKPNQARDAIFGQLLQPIVDLYRSRALEGVKSREANAQPEAEAEAEAKKAAAQPPVVTQAVAAPEK